MWWLLLIVLVVIAGFAVPRFGKALLVFSGLVIGAAVLYAYRSSKDAEAERLSARSRITPEDIELAELQLRPTYGTGSYQLTGRLKNRSMAYSVTQLRLRLTMDDCDASPDGELERALRAAHAAGDTVTARRVAQEIRRTAPECETVGQEEQLIYLTVPPRQARAIDESVYFSDLGEPRGKHQWHYNVVEVLAR